jgi:hypothetical protein
VLEQRLGKIRGNIEAEAALHLVPALQLLGGNGR